MKKIGIVGGVAWQSTVDYYSGLCRRSEQWHTVRILPGTSVMPEIAIESLDHAKVLSHLGHDGDEDSWSEFDAYHRQALERLEASGADFALIASNTPHHRFESIVRGIRIPVISIVDAAARQCAKICARKLILLGTATTMASAKFREGFARHGVDARGPDDENLRQASVALLTDLQRGKTVGATERMKRLAKDATAQFPGLPAICLACTELPLAFPERSDLATFEEDGVLYINANVIHINAAFAYAIAEP